MLSKIANQWFSFFLPYTEEIIAQEAAVPTHKTRLGVFTNTVLLLLDLKLSIYGEKRRKTEPELVCLQYANLYSTARSSFLV